MDLYKGLLEDVHRDLPAPSPTGKNFLTKRSFRYYHYACDGFKDQVGKGHQYPILFANPMSPLLQGWGCAYRTCQSMASWVIGSRGLTDAVPPSLPEIQRILVAQGDKPESFLGSRDWIGAMEVFYTLDALYDVPCKILHLSSGHQLPKHAQELCRYFESHGGLIMMGGDVDSSSKGIAGIHINGEDVFLLVIDPHFVSESSTTVNFTREHLHRLGYIRWQHSSQFIDSSFYNLCLPMVLQK